MNEGGGLVAFDASGFRNNGTLTNMDPGTDWVGGQRGWALDFDGSNDYVDLANPSSLNITGELTISAWVYVRGATNQGDDIFTRDKNSSDRGYRLVFDSDDTVAFYVAQDATTKIQAAVSGRTPYQNLWVHVVGVYLPSTYVRVYLTGALQAENTTSVPASIRSSTVGPRIGMRGDNLQGWTDGLIDEVRIYNRVLDPDEIASLFTDPFLEFRTRRRRIFKAAAAAGDATISATDSGRVAATEAQAPTATLAPADTAVVAETDATSLLATLGPADISAVGESESTALAPTIGAADTSAVAESDASGITAALGPTDASALGAVEAVGALTAALAASEADAAGLSEQAPIDATISAAETGRIAALETASVVEIADVSATESGRVGVTETASVVEGEPAEAPAAIPEVFTAGWVRVPPVPAPGYGLRRRGRLVVLGPVGVVLAVGRTHAPRRGVASVVGRQGQLDGRARLIRLVRMGRVASSAGAGVLRAVGVTVSPDLIAQRTREETELLTLLEVL